MHAEAAPRTAATIWSEQRCHSDTCDPVGHPFTGWLLVGPALLAYFPSMPRNVIPVLSDDDGDRAGADDKMGGDALEEVQEVPANFLLPLIVLHVVGVFIASHRHLPSGFDA